MCAESRSPASGSSGPTSATASRAMPRCQDACCQRGMRCPRRGEDAHRPQVEQLGEDQRHEDVGSSESCTGPIVTRGGALQSSARSTTTTITTAATTTPTAISIRKAFASERSG